MEEKDYEGFVKRIDQIDRILDEPVRHLIGTLERSIKDGNLQIPWAPLCSECGFVGDAFHESRRGSTSSKKPGRSRQVRK